MKQVRITHPVMGMIVTAMIGMGCLAAAPATRSIRSDIIRPGDGVGPIQLGMSESELEAAIGKPATVPWNQPPTVREYPGRGVTILLSKTEPRTVAMILGGRGEGILNSVLVAPYALRTAEGLGMGSTADELAGAYGPPDSDQRSAQTDWRMMSYASRGVEFGLREGQVVWVAVRKATTAK
jgi:hypothetical protein